MKRKWNKTCQKEFDKIKNDFKMKVVGDKIELGLFPITGSLEMKNISDDEI